MGSPDKNPSIYYVIDAKDYKDNQYLIYKEFITPETDFRNVYNKYSDEVWKMVYQQNYVVRLIKIFKDGNEAVIYMTVCHEVIKEGYKCF